MSDRYQTISTISAGAAGIICRGWDKHQNRDVSIQRIRVEGAAAEEVLRQARALYGLRHPNVATVLEYGSDSEGVYLVREMIKGKGLETLVGQRALTHEEFSALVKQTLRAMHEAHMCGLIHGNLQPGTLMIPWNAKETFAIKIADFTLGAPGDPAVPRPLEAERYMAPEQFGHALLTLRADLYSLGAIYYFCLTQQPPVQGKQSADVVIDHLYHRVVPLADLRPDLPAPLCAWVERLMSVKASDRPGSAEEALQTFLVIPDEEVIVAAAVEEEEAAPVALIEEPAEEVAAATPLSPEPEQDLEPAAAPVEDEPEYSPALTTPLAAAAPVTPERPAQRRTSPNTEPPPKRVRTSATNLILIAFGVTAVGMLILVSLLTHNSRTERQRRLAELSSIDRPQTSDLDVRMLLELLDEPARRDAAADTLAKAEGGNYIDTMVLDHLGKPRADAANIKIIEVIGKRSIQGAVAKVLPYTVGRSGEMSQTAWKAISQTAQADDMAAIIDSLHKSNSRDEEAIVEALASAIEKAADRPRATEAALRGFETTKEAFVRSVLLNVLTRVGGASDTVRMAAAAISDPAEDVRRSAIIALANHPTHEPLAAVAERFPQEQDASSRAYLLLAAKELVTKPGGNSQETLARQAQSLYANAKTAAERERALEVISHVIAPATVTFYESYAEQEDPTARQEALRAAAAFKKRLSEVVSITPGPDATPVPAAGADHTLGGSIALENGVLVNWKQTEDLAWWLIRLPANGSYEVMVYQAHAGNEVGTYEVLLAGQTKLTTAVKTAGDSDFKGFIVGTFQVAEPGIYKLLLRPKSIPPGGELMRVQKVALKPAAP